MSAARFVECAFDKIGKLLDQKDDVAASRYALQHCPTMLDVGTKVMVESMDFDVRASCVRLSGHPQCVWTFSNDIALDK